MGPAGFVLTDFTGFVFPEDAAAAAELSTVKPPLLCKMLKMGPNYEVKGVYGQTGSALGYSDDTTEILLSFYYLQ